MRASIADRFRSYRWGRVDLQRYVVGLSGVIPQLGQYSTYYSTVQYIVYLKGNKHLLRRVEAVESERDGVYDIPGWKIECYGLKPGGVRLRVFLGMF